jgi:hypothetical protein
MVQLVTILVILEILLNLSTNLSYYYGMDIILNLALIGLLSFASIAVMVCGALDDFLN